jgi:predicted secreted hydrolase
VSRLAATIAVSVGLGFASTTAADVTGIRFPRDHFGHPAASIEWWYFTALVRDATGTPYSVFFTLFSSQGTLVPVAQVRNLRTGALVGHSEQLALERVSPSSLDVRAGGARLRYEPGSNDWVFSASGLAFAIRLHQHPVKAYALNGSGTGVINQSLAGTSHYYSGTRMLATGTLHAAGKRIALTGESWLDHQWGSYRDDPRAFNWDWFSCRFDDRTELMLYQFRNRVTGRPLERFRSGTYVTSSGRTVGILAFQATHGPRALHAAGRQWPLDWQLRVPRLKLVENLQSVVRDQLVRNTILPTFWEGAAHATGGRTGTCFVELSYR